MFCAILRFHTFCPLYLIRNHKFRVSKMSFPLVCDGKDMQNRKYSCISPFLFITDKSKQICKCCDVCRLNPSDRCSLEHFLHLLFFLLYFEQRLTDCPDALSLNLYYRGSDRKCNTSYRVNITSLMGNTAYLKTYNNPQFSIMTS